MINIQSKEIEKKIKSLIDRYPNINLKELDYRVSLKKPQTDEEKFRTYANILNYQWQDLLKSNIVMWEIVEHLKANGFVGARVDEYLMGLILNYVFRRYSNESEMRTIIDKIVEYLQRKGNTTFGEFIRTFKASNFMKNKNVPYEVFYKQATQDVAELEEIIAMVERAKQ